MTTLSAPLVETPPRQLEYGDIRDRVEDGDIILFRGTILFSRVIETVSHGAYSHCAIAANWAERKMLLQAELMGGVQAVPLSVAAGTYNGRVDWYKIAPQWRAKLNIPALLTEARADLGLTYATSELLRVAAHELFGSKLPADCDNPHALFCSQYVARCFRKAGLPLATTRTSARPRARSPPRRCSSSRASSPTIGASFGSQQRRDRHDRGRSIAAASAGVSGGAPIGEAYDGRQGSLACGRRNGDDRGGGDRGGRLRAPACTPPAKPRGQQVPRDERPPEKGKQRRRGLEAEDLSVPDRMADAQRAHDPEEDESGEQMAARPGSRIGCLLDPLNGVEGCVGCCCTVSPG